MNRRCSFSQQSVPSCRLLPAGKSAVVRARRVGWRFFSLLGLYVLRVYFLAGFFVVTYGLGIYLLNLLIGFISPQIDPETDEFVLPVRETEEYRPFQRQLPEFKCWLAGVRAVLISIGMTFFSVFDLPVFWPILLVYFILLFILTMKQQIKRMIKYKYLPFSWGKQTYGDITRSKGGLDKARKDGPPHAFGAQGAGGFGAGVASSVSLGQDHLTTPYVLR
ncbi:putative RER1 protein [Besnoitia besnoiti]|uniref:Putative RER1 protein n=1 Tax=Besnoitia besnoiti TaxID=94643 RepID=A0A2A9M9D6_BESBE|nr:putative RER1 protein [Besnoitia besnoiti]PFH31992.1 putative RER1 protein [Besnoitia besnoiti]